MNIDRTFCASEVNNHTCGRQLSPPDAAYAKEIGKPLSFGYFCPQLYVDLDGVLADFDRGYRERFGTNPCKKVDNVDWQLVRRTAGFYRDLPPMADFDVLWSAVEHLNPIILTGVPNQVEEALGNKLAWVEKNIGAHVSVIGCKSVHKSRHGKPGDILIDDWEKHMQLWKNMGGHWITHVSAVDSIRLLQEHMAVLEK